MPDVIYNLSVAGFTACFAVLIVAGIASILGALAEIYCFGSYSAHVGPFFLGIVLKPHGARAPRFTAGSRCTTRGGRLYHIAFGGVGIAVGRLAA